MNKIIKRAWLLFLLAVLPISGRAATLLSENFDNISTLAGSGWTITNNSTAPQGSSYFQGNPGVFPSQAGAPNSYVGANFLNAAPGGNISNWLILPTLTLDSTSQLTFYTQSAGCGFPDRLEVRLSTNGSSANVGGTDTSVGDFTTLLLSINPVLTAAGYPTAWTQFTVSLAVLASQLVDASRSVISLRIPTSTANYIGIDTVLVTGAGGAGGGGVPESSSTLVLCMIGVSGVLGASRYQKARQQRGETNV